MNKKLTIHNIHKIDNMEWQSQLFGIITTHKIRVLSTLEGMYEIHTHYKIHLPHPETKTLLIQIHRKSNPKGEYGIRVFEAGLPRQNLLQRGEGITPEWLKGLIEVL